MIGLPDADWGESIVAVIEPSVDRTADDALADELRQFCRTQLAGYKCPRRVEFRASLPRPTRASSTSVSSRDEYTPTS